MPESSLNIADVPVALLAGGLATRLRPITATIPKCLVEVNGRPFVDHQLELLRDNGVRRVVLCLGHLGDQVRAHLGDGRNFGLQIDYSEDGSEPQGTGGAIRRAGSKLGAVFWVIYGDAYLDVKYPAILDAFSGRGHDGLMTVLANENRWDRSNVLFENGRLVRYDKWAPDPRMRHIDYGIALLCRTVLEKLPPAGPADLADLYSSLVAAGRMTGYEVTQRFYEIGSFQGLAETRAYLASRCQATVPSRLDEASNC